jgi:hypothetical protein
VQGNITSVGTVTAGVWNGTAITGSNIAANTVANSNLAQLGADTIKCNPSGSTANAQDCTRTQVGNLLGEKLSALAFGAVCDSSTDNSTALQNLFNASVTQNKTAYIPGCAFTYNFSTTLNVTGAGFFSVDGEGPNQSVLQYTGAGTAIAIAPASLTSDYLYLRNFGIHNTTLNSAFSGISVSNATLSIIQNVGFFNQYNCLFLGPNAFATRIYNIQATDCGGAASGNAIAFHTDSSANGTLISGGRIGGSGGTNGYGILIPNGNSIGIYGIDIEGMYNGIYLGGTSPGVNGVFIGSGTYIENSGAGTNLYFGGTSIPTGVRSATLNGVWLGASPAVNWNFVNSLTLTGVTTFNFAVSIANTSTAMIQGPTTLGTGGVSWSPGTVTYISPPVSVGILPPPGGQWKGTTLVVLDATACTAGATPVAGGTIACTVFDNGTAWVH